MQLRGLAELFQNFTKAKVNSHVVELEELETMVSLIELRKRGKNQISCLGLPEFQMQVAGLTELLSASFILLKTILSGIQATAGPLILSTTGFLSSSLSM